jgi:TPR repeat protein
MKHAILASFIVLTAIAAEPPEVAQAVAIAKSGKPDDAAALLQKAVTAGSDHARWLLARLHGAGKITGASLKDARVLLEAAAQAGYGPAAYDLARLAEAGALSGGKPDDDQTEFYYRGAAESGLAVAQFRMAQYAARDEKAALDWLKKAAAQKHAPSMLLAARIMDRGTEGAVNAKAAVAMLKDAADMGYAPAINDLGVRASEGRGVEKSPEAAFAYFKDAAGKGLAAAEVNLSVCLAQGIGCAKDPAAAAKRLVAAERMGHPVAEFLAAEGAEKAKELAQAYTLYARAAEAPNAEAAKRRDALKARLSPAQLKKAEAAIAAAAKLALPAPATDYFTPPVPDAAFAAKFPSDQSETLAGLLIVTGSAVPPHFTADGGTGVVKMSAGKVTQGNW